ncbi:hypothetical protein [Eilatimonas milleporae]|uniref:Type IV secretion system protein VirB2 n=1 Tax=Eilatimonas milleporae TaxID=911205 RepID=A0A3M0C9L4_9PROT|nr:hypothetical protein [Eilatimonas milleporae]RMB05040.1 hypothetical protein BXY39_2619 [Eilatimonas milleporae]
MHKHWSDTLYESKSSLHAFLLLFLAFAFAAPVTAFTPPAAGDLGFAFYDTLILQGVQGPIGFTTAFLTTILGVYGISQRNWLAAIGGFGGATAMVAGEGIVTSVGMVV